jgi:hypothetical protein
MPHRAMLTATGASPFLPPSSAQHIGLTSTSMTLVVAVVGIALFLLATAVLFRDPLSQMAKAHLLDSQKDSLSAQQQAQYHTLERVVTQRLNDATHALERLQASNTRLKVEAESILGQSFGSAVATPPVRLNGPHQCGRYAGPNHRL